MKCSKCQFDNRVDAQFCIECGERLVLACPLCEKLLPLSAKFCDKCGSKCGEGEQPDFNRVFFRFPKDNLDFKTAMDAFKKAYVKITLKRFHGNRSRAAKALNIQRTYLSRLIAKYEIDDI